MTTQREKDIEHFLNSGATTLRRKAETLADGAEHGRRDLARKVLDLITAPGWRENTLALHDICQAVLQDQAPAAPEPVPAPWPFINQHVTTAPEPNAFSRDELCEQATENERAAIVKYLRKHDHPFVADRIESGEHHK